MTAVGRAHGGSEPGVRIEAAAIALDFARPLVTASATYARRATWLIRATDAFGGFGFGEAAPLPDFGGEPLDAVAPAIEVLARVLEGTASGAFGADEPVDVAAAAAVCGAFRAIAPDAPCARAAVELALCDLAARRAGLPLWRWLAGDALDGRGDLDTGLDRLDSPLRAGHVASGSRTATGPELPVNATVGAEAPDRAAELAREAAAAGFSAIKVKVGVSDADDVARIAAIRTAVGEAVTLRADANGAWSRSRARAMCRALASFGLEYVEQPVPAADVEGLAELRESALVPIAADEALLEPDGARRVHALGAADVWVLKPSLLGGPLQALEVAALARGSGAALTVTSALDSAVGRAGAAHVAAVLAIGGDLRACGLATDSLLRKDVADGPAIHAGRLSLTGAPGLGIGRLDVPGGAWRPAAVLRESG